jgi:RHS repeat-associated protein
VCQWKYDEYGNLLQECPELNHYTYTGQEYDAETGLLHFFARYYDAEMGVWLIQDTYRGNVDDPKSVNRYHYVGNSPIRIVDIYGWGWGGAGLGAIVGFFLGGVPGAQVGALAGHLIEEAILNKKADNFVEENVEDIKQIAEEENVDPDILGGTVRDEIYEHDLAAELLDSVGGSESTGVGAVKLSTARDVYPEKSDEDLKKLLADEVENIRIVAKYLSDRQSQAKENARKAGGTRTDEEANPFAVGYYQGSYSALSKAQVKFLEDNSDVDSTEQLKYENIEPYMTSFNWKTLSYNRARINRVIDYELPEPKKPYEPVVGMPIFFIPLPM